MPQPTNNYVSCLLFLSEHHDVNNLLLKLLLNVYVGYLKNESDKDQVKKVI